MKNEKTTLPTVDPTRRQLLSVAAVGAVAATTMIAPAMAGMHPDAVLIELGARFEPLVDRYYVARRRWSAALVQAHAEHYAEFGDPADLDFECPPDQECLCG